VEVVNLHIIRICREDFPVDISTNYCTLLFFSWLDGPSGPRPSYFWGSSITRRHTTLSRTRLDEWPPRSRDVYLTAPNTHKRKTWKFILLAYQT